LAVSLLAVAASLNPIMRWATTFPSEQNRSAFLTNYSPEPVLEPFFKRGEPVGRSSGWSGGAGLRQVTHTRNFWLEFRTDHGDPAAMMTKVQRDVERRLQTSGARITDELSGLGGTFLVRYAVGRSVGSVKGKLERGSPGTDDTEVVVKVDITEKWSQTIDFPSLPPSRSAS
jgi:hypothetical protein